MTTKIQFRRKVIVIVLLCVAVGGAVVRHYATPGTTTRDIATLLMVLWVPIIGNVIAWLVSKRPRRAPRAAAATAATPPSFDTAGAFTPHARVELVFRKPGLPSQDVPIAPGEYRCALVVDKEGFSARWVVSPGEPLERGKPAVLDIEFLSPAVARAKLPAGADFRVLVGEAFIADGRVLQAQ
jgi:hypothetical protein